MPEGVLLLDLRVQALIERVHGLTKREKLCVALSLGLLFGVLDAVMSLLQSSLQFPRPLSEPVEFCFEQPQGR
uniref:Uncharacterized protein n=1 Tax=Thermosporothrix sp. COM3 TaxID=2490863 RepID=A0A455SW08_9CHLR|nr:hypothetical protein KTC_65170 [Thermosporothrix sp. COM3]